MESLKRYHYNCKMANKFAEVYGWYGVVSIAIAYALVSFGMVAADSAAFQLLNLTGAGGIIYISIIKKAYQGAVLNTLWAAIATIALFKIVFKF